MEFKISEQILEKYPELNIGVIIAKNLNNNHDSKEIQEKMREQEAKTREKINPETVTEIPIIAKWREIYRSFRARPSEYRNSAEAVLKRALKKELPKINMLVDVYNYISLKYTMTVGGEDIDNIRGYIILDFATSNEEFIPLGENENNPPWQNEVVYKDDKGVICRCWNWREADRTKLTKNTKNAVIVIENLILEDNEKFKQALEELKDLIEKHCNADCKIKILNKDNSEVEVR